MVGEKKATSNQHAPEKALRLNRGHMRDSTHQVCSSRSLNIVREDEEGYMEVRVT